MSTIARCATGAGFAGTVAMWNFAELADHLIDALREAEARLRIEQAVYGLDVRDERGLHDVLATALAARYDVAREVHYPSSTGGKLRDRQRCDLVLTGVHRPLRISAGGLFAVGDTEPEDALWIEVKVAYQFREGGARHRGYGAQWRTHLVRDLVKMEADPRIRHAALALIVFNETEAVLRKDLDLLETVLADKALLAGFRHVRSTVIQDRIGHTRCSVALWPTLLR